MSPAVPLILAAILGAAFIARSVRSCRATARRQARSTNQTTKDA